MNPGIIGTDMLRSCFGSDAGHAKRPHTPARQKAATIPTGRGINTWFSCVGVVHLAWIFFIAAAASFLSRIQRNGMQGGDAASKCIVVPVLVNRMASTKCSSV